MVGLFSSSNHIAISPYVVGFLKSPLIPSLGFVVNARRKQGQAVCVCFLAGKNGGSFWLKELKRKNGVSWCCPCKDSESDGDAALEAEILEFMKKSKKPKAFPTKKELMDSGRIDLVEAIRKRGGWLSLGWELDDENGPEKVPDADNTAMDWDDAILEFQRKVGIVKTRNTLKVTDAAPSDILSPSMDSSQPASPSHRPLEMVTGEEKGIEGILNRLEKQRNLSFGIDSGKENDVHGSTKNDVDDSHFGTSIDADRADLGMKGGITSGSPSKGIYNDSGGKISLSESVSDTNSLRNPVKPETWRTWSIQRAGSLDTEFEAAEICFHESQRGPEKDALKDKILATTDIDDLGRQKEIDHNQIRTRLQHLELELASTLSTLRSKNDKTMLKGDQGSSTSDFENIADAWEFQQNEFMNAQDRLRSIRAKLAVVEGKLALAVIDAQKLVEEKQKRIDGAQRALQLLRTACVVWPNSGSEVLLAGSFDGWTTQRKMEKSSTGIFSVCLKLYPGKYEIKFIVDGTWRIDPIRPIVHNNGFENNLLIIT